MYSSLSVLVCICSTRTHHWDSQHLNLGFVARRSERKPPVHAEGMNFFSSLLLCNPKLAAYTKLVGDLVGIFLLE
ncbi:hypothetical protein BJX70DRAFT_369720 [Aspergillus crustosus]